LGVFFTPELESINHQPHRRFGRIDVFLLRDVFLQDVVLQGTGDFLPVRALLFRYRQYMAQITAAGE